MVEKTDSGEQQLIVVKYLRDDSMTSTVRRPESC